jgi:hypothetical protein
MLGFSSTAGYARYEQAKVMGDDAIPIVIVQKLLPLFVNRGTPSITTDEMLSVAGPSGASLKKSVVDNQSVKIEADAVRVKCRVRPDSYSPQKPLSDLGVSSVVPSMTVPVESQFVAVVEEAMGPFKVGAQLHCVEASEWTTSGLRGRQVVVWIRYGNTDLWECAVALNTPSGLVRLDNNKPCVGTVIGAVIGVYTRQ